MMKLTVPDMSCGHCMSSVTDAVRRVDGGAKVEIDLQAKTVAIGTSADRKSIEEALAQAGYPAGAA